MKKILFLLMFLVSIAAQGQKTLAQMQTEATVIRDETIPHNNSALRVGQTILDLANSLVPVIDYAVATTTSSNVYVASVNPVVVQYVHGQLFRIEFQGANTGSSTLNLNGLGSVLLTLDGSTALSGGEIKAGQQFSIYYNGTAFQLNGGGGGGVTSFNSRTGAVMPQSGDYNAFYLPLAGASLTTDFILNAGITNTITLVGGNSGGGVTIKAGAAGGLAQVLDENSTTGFNTSNGEALMFNTSESIDMPSSGAQILVTGSAIGFKGLLYAADYSAGYVAQSLTDKNYNDTHFKGLAFTNSPSTNQVANFNGTNWTFSAVTNAMLSNSSITIAGNSTALGSSVTQDQITGLSSTGLIKRTAANTLAIATANTDYLAASNPAYTGTMTTGTMGFSDTGNLLTAQSSTNSYNQLGIQNTSNGTAASTNFVANNDQATSTTNYGEFGINSSTFTGSGAWNIAGAVYLDAASGDVAIGTLANKPLHFFTNSSTTDNLSISGAGVFTYTVPINGSVYTSTWTATANSQNAFEYNGTVTSRNTASDNFNYLVIDPTLARNAGNPATQTATAVLINPTFSNSPATTNILRLQNGGSDRTIFDGNGNVNITTPSVAANNAINVISSASNRSTIYNQNTNSAGNASLYLENNRGSFASYGGLLHNGSTASGTFFGLNKADATFLISDGASSSGLGIGTLVSTPLLFGTNGSERGRFGASTGDFLIGSTSDNARLYAVQPALSASWIPAFRLDAGANTGITLSTEQLGSIMNVNAVTQQWATGALPVQRFVYFGAPTVAFVGASTATDVYNVYVEAPAQGTNATITNPWALGVNGNMKVAGNIKLNTAGNRFLVTEGSNGIVGQVALVSGTKAVTVNSTTASSRCFTTLVSVGGTVTTTVNYSCACTSNTVTITALTSSGSTNTSDTSTLNYWIVN